MNLQGEAHYRDKDFIVGNGTILTYDRCISLHAVSMIKIQDKRKVSLTYPIIMIVLGLVMLFIPLLSLIGGVLIFFGGLIVALLLWAAHMQMYGLEIVINTGAVCVFEHKDLEFIRKVADIIRKALDDCAVSTYIDMRGSKVKTNYVGGDFYSFGKQNSFGDLIIGDDNRIEKESHNTTTINHATDVLTLEEWNRLERYFRIRGEELGNDHQAYPACKELEKYARNKDAKGMRAYLKSIGKTVFTAILTKATESGLAEIFRKLASIKM